LLLIAAWLALPGWIETRLAPDLARRYGLGEVRLDIRRIGLTGMDAAGIRIGEAVALDHLTVDFHPARLARGRIERIALSGLTLRVVQDETGLRLDGLPPFRSASPSALPSLRPSGGWIGRLEISNGLLVLKSPRNEVRLPFTLDVTPEGEALFPASARLALWPRVDPVRATLRADIGKGELTASFQADNARLDFLDALTPAAARMVPKGRVSARAEARLVLSPSPRPTDGNRAAASDAKSIAITGDFTVSFTPDETERVLKFVPSGIRGTLAGHMEGAALWQAKVGIVPTRTAVDLDAGGWKARIVEPRLDIDLSGEKSSLTLAARFGTRQGRIDTGAMSIVWPELAAEAGGTLKLADSPAARDLRFTVRVPRCSADNDLLQAGTGEINVRGRIRPGREPRVSADVQARSGHIQWPGLRLAAENIALDLPLQWPAPDAPEGGMLSMERLVWRNLATGRLRLAIMQSGPGLSLEGTWEAIPTAGTALKIAARADLVNAGLTASLDARPEPGSPAAPIDLGVLLPAAAGVTVDGKPALHAAVSLDAGRLRSEARLQLSDGLVAVAKKHIRLAGIQTDLELTDLVRLRSAPGQTVRFTAADLGGIALSDGAVQFQLEGPRQVLLESGSFGWCGGRVYTQAMRLAPGAQDYALTLFCDRLRLAQLLDQVGGLSAEGGGTVSGRIPVHYRPGGVYFNDGFLYSSPGEGGKIRLTGVDRLSEGIGPETLEAAQLALASEALKDYDYTWVKVGLNSLGDQLALRLQFDGKPTHPLPFVYHREEGRFVRVPPGHPGSRFQGLGLDVNVRLPLNRILQYGGVMERLE
jgi:hypothetical protein